MLLAVGRTFSLLNQTQIVMPLQRVALVLIKLRIEVQVASQGCKNLLLHSEMAHAGAQPLQVGKWLDMKGWNKASMSRRASSALKIDY